MNDYKKDERNIATESEKKWERERMNNIHSWGNVRVPTSGSIENRSNTFRLYTLIERKKNKEREKQNCKYKQHKNGAEHFCSLFVGVEQTLHIIRNNQKFRSLEFFFIGEFR